jgi:hypothetical protein
MTPQAAFETFLQHARQLSEDGGPDIGAVLTDAVIEENREIAEGWAMTYLPGGLSAANNPGWHELAFTGAISLLQADPNYLSWAERIKAFRAFSNTIPAAVYKMIYYNDAAYTQKLSHEQRQVLETLGGQKGFAYLVDSKLPAEQKETNA